MANSGDANGAQDSTSSPEAAFAPFLVSAPGKLIVFGEHAVVYGKSAMAASISLRSYIHVTPTEQSSPPTVTLHFVDISLNHSWSISSLPWTIFSNARASAAVEPPTSLDTDLLASLTPHVASISPDIPADKRKIHQQAATTFLYLYLLLATEHTPPATYTLRSTIPIGAGLGSSASISVCLATAMLLLPNTPGAGSQSSAHLAPPPSHDLSELPDTDAQSTLDRINALAFLGESVIHGTPSGLDNTVATLGKAVIFKRSSIPGQPSTITSIRRFPELPLLIVDTKQAKSTAAEVAKVRVLRDAQPAVVNCILDSINAITESARLLLQQEDEYDLLGQTPQKSTAGNTDTAEHLASLVRINHGLLSALGVSHPRLEQLRTIVDAAQIGAFKLTGAGGGGCGFVLLRPEFKDAVTSGVADIHDAGAGSPASVLHRAEREIDAAGMERFETVLGGPGVGVLFAGGHGTVDGQAVDGERGISREEFLAAEGAAGLTALVERRREWRYWRS